ncbi:MAG: 50S ribosomal protein L29 [Candidatus Aramenus sp.]|nr:50S ribosomal protein L29 [Candidatus Aramenus sp.]
MPHKRNEFLKNIKNLDIAEVQKRLQDMEMDLVKLRAESRVGTIKDTAAIRNTRKNIARILTVLSEKRKASNAQKPSQK